MTGVTTAITGSVSRVMQAFSQSFQTQDTNVAATNQSFSEDAMNATALPLLAVAVIVFAVAVTGANKK